MKVFYTEDQKFEVRPWGGRMCFLATEESAQSKLLGVTAVLRMGQGLTHSTHTHDDCDELIGFFGSDPDNPSELGGQIEFTIGGEPHLLTKSSIIFVPAGTSHNPMRILQVDRPIFHFSVVTKRAYTTDIYK